MTLPEPPEQHVEVYIERPDPPSPSGRWWTLALVVVVFSGATIAVAGYLHTPGVKPVPKESPSEAPVVNNANPCGHNTFDENACAVRIVMVSSQQAGVSPSATVAAMCDAYDTPKKQRELVEKWMSQGAYRAEARAVLDQILSYCPEEVS